MSTRLGVLRSTPPVSPSTTFSSASRKSWENRWPRSEVIATRVGGGFGGKHASNIHSIAAWLAREARRPVKLTLSRMQDFEIQRSRHPARIWLKTGARRDGTILARDAMVILDGGAYTDESPAVLAFALLMVRGPYRIANARARGHVVYTNKLRAGSFRGFGNPQACFAGESQLDELAAKLGIDPVELRLKNAMRPGDTAFGGEVVRSCVLTECLTRVRDAQRQALPLPPRLGRKRGIGYSVMAHVSGLMGTAANVQLRTDGSIALATGCVDLGQGSDTVMVQICADALSVPIERVSYAPQDTELVTLQLENRGQPLDLHDRARRCGRYRRIARQNVRARERDAGMRHKRS